jgi:hypothetical protein
VRMGTTDIIIDRVNGLAEEELRTGEDEFSPSEMIGINKNPDGTESIANKNTKKGDAASDTTEPGNDVDDNLNDQHIARTRSENIVNKPSSFLGITQGLDPDSNHLKLESLLLVS